MATFIELFKLSPHAYWLNLETIEQVDPESRTVWVTSGDDYKLDDDDFREVMDFVSQHKLP